MNGETVKIERLGIFRLGFDTKGEATEEAVSEKDILQAKILFRPDVKIKSKLKSTVYKKAASSKKEKRLLLWDNLFLLWDKISLHKKNIYFYEMISFGLIKKME